MHPSSLKAQQTKRHLISVDPLASAPNIVFVKGSRKEVNDRIAKDTAFGWQASDPVRRINLRSLDDRQVVARYINRDATGHPIVVSYLRYNATEKRI